MVDAGIGRLLVASLHQGIAEVAPARLPFYENWLKPPGLRDRRFGLAPLHAVLSFLRLEGRPVYDRIMTRAGQYTADWSYMELPAVQRSVVRTLPGPLRTRAALHLSGRMVRHTFRGARARSRLRKGTATIDLRASIFCTVRETADWPMCVFYSAAVERFLRRSGLDAQVDVNQCKALGGGGCTMTVSIRSRRAEQPAADVA